jgi:hypothetical protein
MKLWQPTALAQAAALALGASLSGGVAAQSNADLLKEIQALKSRVAELEGKAKAADAAKPASAQWGMTPEQTAEFNRIAVKTEATEDNLESWGLKGLTISGYMDPTYIYNRNQSRAGFQFLNSQGDGFFYDTSYIGAASIDFTKETESGSRFKLTLSPNRGAGAAIDGGRNIVQEASMSVPITDLQFRFTAGQVPDWSGYEYQQPTLNPFITHNLLFDFTLPTTYTGVGLDYTQGKWWLRGMLANINSTIRDAKDKSPALVYRVDYSRGEFQGFGFAGLHGRTTNFNLCRDDECTSFDKTMTHLFEFDAYFIRGDWTVQGQVSYGRQKQGGIVPDADGNFRDSEWLGLSALAGYYFTPRLQALVRGDYIRNNKNGGGLLGYTGYWEAFGIDGPYGDYRNGIGPDPTLGCEDQTVAGCDKGANRYALSFGLKYAYNLNTTFKLEYRRDGANLPVFFDVKSGAYRKNNDLLGASVVLFF